MAERNRFDDLEEVWKDIPNYEGLYQASTWGRVKSRNRYIRHSRGGTRLWPGRILKPWIVKSGDKKRNAAVQVDLCKDGRIKTYEVHYLVLITFVGPKPEGTECCHGNGDATDNNVNNLRWDTRKSNNVDKINHGMSSRGERNPNSKLTNESVKAIKNWSNEGKQLDVIHKLVEKDFGIKVGRDRIASVINNKSWKHVT